MSIQEMDKHILLESYLSRGKPKETKDILFKGRSRDKRNVSSMLRT